MVNTHIDIHGRVIEIGDKVLFVGFQSRTLEEGFVHGFDKTGKRFQIRQHYRAKKWNKELKNFEDAGDACRYYYTDSVYLLQRK